MDDRKIIVNSSLMGSLVVKRITKLKARELIIKHHYSHKIGDSHGLFSYGIFREGRKTRKIV